MRKKKTVQIVFALILSVIFVAYGNGNSKGNCSNVKMKTEVAEEENSEKKIEDAGHMEVENESDINTTVFDESKEQTSSETASDFISTLQKNTTSSEKAEEHVHVWVVQTKTVNHVEEGHYESKVIQKAYDDEVYAWRTFCNKCGNDISDLKAEEIAFHSAILCGSGYHADYVVVDIVHYGAVTEQVWVVDKAAWTETVTTGYLCSCGASK